MESTSLLVLSNWRTRNKDWRNRKCVRVFLCAYVLGIQIQHTNTLLEERNTEQGTRNGEGRIPIRHQHPNTPTRFLKERNEKYLLIRPNINHP